MMSILCERHVKQKVCQYVPAAIIDAKNALSNCAWSAQWYIIRRRALRFGEIFNVEEADDKVVPSWSIVS